MPGRPRCFGTVRARLTLIHIRIHRPRFKSVDKRMKCKSIYGHAVKDTQDSCHCLINDQMQNVGPGRKSEEELMQVE